MAQTENSLQAIVTWLEETIKQDMAVALLWEQESHPDPPHIG